MQNSPSKEESHELNEPTLNILEEGLLHKIMLFFHLPTRLPGVFVALLALVLAGLTGAGWWLFTGDWRLAQWVGGLMALFMAADMALLLLLPRQKVSFGPWKAQLFALALPRVAAALGVALAARLLPGEWPLWLFGGTQVLGTAAFMRGYLIEPFKLELTDVTIFTDRLPVDTAPVRLLHISDLHIERLTAREGRVLELARQAAPDLIVISGDYVNLSYNRDPVTLKQVGQLLHQLSAPHGVFATLGSPPVDLRETVVPVFDDLPHVTLLRHGWQQVEMGNGRSLTVLGMDCSHDLPVDASRLARLVAAAPSDYPQLLVYHSPELMPEAAEHGIDLYVCGHTHGGQVRLPLVGPIFTSSQLGRRFVMGLYKIGRTTLYVSRGIGLEGLSAPRVRFLCPPEMTLITLMPMAEK